MRRYQSLDTIIKQEAWADNPPQTAVVEFVRTLCNVFDDEHDGKAYEVADFAVELDDAMTQVIKTARRFQAWARGEETT